MSKITDQQLHGLDIENKIEWTRRLDYFASYANFDKKPITVADGNTIKVDFDKGSLVFMDENMMLRILQLK